MKKSILLSAATLTALALTGCVPAGVIEVTDAEEQVDPTPVEDPAPAEEMVGEVEDEFEAMEPMSDSAQFGQTVTFPDGLEVTITHKSDSYLSEYGAAGMCSAGDPVKVYHVEFVNGTDDYFDPYGDTSLYGLYIDKDGYDTEADDVFDEVDGEELDSLMSFAELRPGGRGRGSVGFCMDDHNADFVLAVDTDWDGSNGRDVVTFY